MDNRAWDTVKWRLMKAHLGYSQEEMELFRSNPRNEVVIDKARDLSGRRIIAEVVQAHGCSSHHRVGDRFVFDGAGNLLTRDNPEKLCIFALSAASGMIFAASELFYAGVDPNQMRFRRSGCFDVGLGCGGWGRIVLEMSMTEVAEAGGAVGGSPADRL